jgi:hypothetical protein
MKCGVFPSDQAQTLRIIALRDRDQEIQKRDDLILEAMDWINEYRVLDSVGIEDFRTMGEWIKRAERSK